MQKYFDAEFTGQAGLAAHAAPGTASTATRHGGFDDDAATLAQVVAFIKARR